MSDCAVEFSYKINLFKVGKVAIKKIISGWIIESISKIIPQHNFLKQQQKEVITEYIIPVWNIDRLLC